jgi:hypothetical protein
MQNNVFAFSIIPEEKQTLFEDFPPPPKLTRERSCTVELGENVGLQFPLGTKKVVLLKKGQIYPKALAPVTTEQHGDIETTATRTVIGMEPLEGLLDEFPDSIRETIIKVLDE